MALINRIEDFIKSEFNALLDKSECPNKSRQCSYRELQDALDSCRALSARLICEKKTVERQIKHQTSQAQDWYDKAQYALEKEREDLAKAAIIEKHKCEQSLDHAQHQLSELSSAIEKLDSDIATLKEKIHLNTRPYSTQPVKEQAVLARLKIKELLHNPVIQGVATQLELLERKLQKAESKVESFEATETQTNQTKSAFNELLKHEKVESTLKSLKEKLASASSRTTTAN
ncbi:PspA/IM30 family protein [Pseudoalteromonas luteoviolacea]|uniref:PspA/IM30 family protein n=1 Tax=Pseudoalteromonas luteoviolacea TaxID=43657 RepID=UPI00163CC6A7|nr:PspA/IM30 family protein [Pseudoalteromonas luteoviolacea]